MAMSASLNRELLYLVLQFLDEEKFKETIHKLEQESGIFFNLRHFEHLVQAGEWDKIESYLSGFTKVDDNRFSMKMFFELRKQKFLEALDRQDRIKALEILTTDLRVFATFNAGLYMEITQLLTLDNFRDNDQLSKYTDTMSARAIMCTELRKLIEANPMFNGKLEFPSLRGCNRLKTLINQSLNWQHQLCKHPRHNPDMTTLFVDHSCEPPSNTRAPSPVMNHMMHAAGLQRPGNFPQGPRPPFQPSLNALSTPIADWMASSSHMQLPQGSAGPVRMSAPNSAGHSKRARTPSNNVAMNDYRTPNFRHAVRRSVPTGVTDEVHNPPINTMPPAFTHQLHSQCIYSANDLPQNVLMSLQQGSAVRSLDFHPMIPIILLVGTIAGDAMVWELMTGKKAAFAKFSAWNLAQCSAQLHASLLSEHAASINRVKWSPNGALFGVAYSKNLIHLYSYNGTSELINHLEIEAHAGPVNDIAFCYPITQLCVVTCGEDRLIKVWDSDTGAMLHIFEGHNAPVYSVCPHYNQNGNVQFMFSTGVDGKIKAWLYDNKGPRVDYDAPNRSVTTMAYSPDGERLFSCGTARTGESYLVEWNEKDGIVMRTYLGLGKQSDGVVQFDIIRNRFLVAGDDSMIKFWDMDNVNPILTLDGEGGLPTSPCIKLDKNGSLLAISARDNSVKVLANEAGFKLLHNMENHIVDDCRVIPPPAVKASTYPDASPQTSAAHPATNVDHTDFVSTSAALSSGSRSLADANTIGEESIDKPRAWKVPEITELSQCLSKRLPDIESPAKICRVMYANTGKSMVALPSDGKHKMWKWDNMFIQDAATAGLLPYLVHHINGVRMKNDLSGTNPANAVHCCALSKNDSYLVSASGGSVTLFNTMNFRTMTRFMGPSPPPTFLVFHPEDNNIIAIGMEDATIKIYNVRSDDVVSTLVGHQKRITGLAFSPALKVLVSSSADGQLCVWDMDPYTKVSSKSLHMVGGKASADTCIQFHQDQIHLLVVHPSRIAIFEAPRLECLKQWIPQERGPITNATYACDSQSVFISFEDGSISVLTAPGLRLRCRINPSAYLTSNPSAGVYPVFIAAHPSEPNQIALGLTDGGICVLEPLDEGEWGEDPPENVSATSAAPSGAAGADQPQK